MLAQWINQMKKRKMEEDTVKNPKESVKKLPETKDTILQFGYFIPHSRLTKAHIATIEQDLHIPVENWFTPASSKTVSKPNPKREPKKRKKNDKESNENDEKNENEQSADKVTKAYLKTDQGYHLPRCYGVDTFGPAAQVRLSAGEPMNPDLKCELTLLPEKKQPEAIALITERFKGTMKCGVLSLPCGWGKTDCAIYTAVNVMRELTGSAKRTLVIVPDTVLLKQWKQRIELRVPGVKVGILRQDTIEIQGMDFTIAMVHSLACRETYPDLDTFGLVILDEAHHMTAPMFSRALYKVPATFILGLSATPEDRLPKIVQCLYWSMGTLIYKPSRPKNHNVQVRVLWYSNTHNKEIKTRDGKPLTHIMLAKMMKDTTRNAYLIDVILDYYKDPRRNILVISKRLVQMDSLFELLIQCGVASHDIGMLRGKTKEDERQEHQKRRIVFAIEKLGKEGLDAPHLNTLIFALPLSGVEQPTGRILRNVENTSEHSDYEAADEDVDNKRPLDPHVVYLADPYSLYEKMAWKNIRQWKSFGYHVQRIDTDTDYTLKWIKLQRVPDF
jgi:superfamily II DNA or RNA helicase